MGEREFMVRGLGYVKDIRDLEQIPLGVGAGGTPLSLSDVANITIGPEIRRGLADWNGEGETVGGIVVVRSGADTLSTIARVKERLAELEAGLPDDVEISVGYDRTGLIHDSIETLTDTLIEESIIVALVCIIFLFHFRSAFVAIISIPISILLAFIIMRIQGLGANIMSLGGIAISIGVLVDAAVVMVENAHKHYEEWRGERSHFEIILRSAQEVGPTLFFSLLLITVSFMPVFTLQAQEGRLFKPLAFTKTYSMAMASIVAVTVIPVLMFWFVRGKIHSEKKHPVSRLLRCIYTPVLNAAPSSGAGSSSCWRSPPWPRCGSPSSTSARSSCRRCGRAICSTCRPPSPASPSPRPGSCCSRPTRSSPPSPRWSRCSARSAAPRPPPTRRRCR